MGLGIGEIAVIKAVIRYHPGINEGLAGMTIKTHKIKRKHKRLKVYRVTTVCERRL